MPTGAAGDDANVFDLSKLFLGNLHLVEQHLAGIAGNASQCGVAHRAWLLVNFLQHEVLETTLLGHDRVPGNSLGLVWNHVALKVSDLHSLWGQYCHFGVTQKDHVTSVGQNGRNVRSDKGFAFTHSHDDRRSNTCRYNLVWIFG